MPSVNAITLDPSRPAVVYAATERGLRRTTNHGRTWQVVPALGRRTVRAVVIDPQSHSTIYAATSEAGIFRSTDDGVTWTQFNDGLASLSVRALAFGASSTGTVLYAGTEQEGVVDFRS
jgi:hypothetical protein